MSPFVEPPWKRGDPLPAIPPPAPPAPTLEAKRKQVMDRRVAIAALLGALAVGTLAAVRANTLTDHNEEAETVREMVGDVDLDFKAIQGILDKLSTASESELQEYLRKLGYVYDAVTGNYLNPKTFSPEVVKKLQEDPLESYTFHGRDGSFDTFRFRKSFGDKLQLAEEKMEAAGKGHLFINSSFRSNAKQQSINNDATVSVKAKIGSSQHEVGLAADIGNWKVAEPYLKEFGINGGYAGIEEDWVHFSTKPAAGIMTQVRRRAKGLWDSVGGILKK